MNTLQIYTNNQIILNGNPINLYVKQDADRTRFYSANPYKEVFVSRDRYTLSRQVELNALADELQTVGLGSSK